MINLVLNSFYIRPNYECKARLRTMGFQKISKSFALKFRSIFGLDYSIVSIIDIILLWCALDERHGQAS